jgi:hypothetical protein
MKVAAFVMALGAAALPLLAQETVFLTGARERGLSLCF